MQKSRAFLKYLFRLLKTKECRWECSYNHRPQAERENYTVVRKLSIGKLTGWKDSHLFSQAKGNVKGKMEEWISVKDRLPEKPGKEAYEHVWCLVALTRGFVTVLAWNCEHEVWDDEDGDDVSRYNSQVTHWMLLPKPPKTV